MNHLKLRNIATRFNQTAEITISDTPKRDMSSGYKDDKINVKQSKRESNASIKKKEEEWALQKPKWRWKDTRDSLSDAVYHVTIQDTMFV